MENEILLWVEDVYASYGKFDILRGVSLNVRTGEIVSIIGPNGAGKSTLFSTIFGFLHPHHGQILFQGNDITHADPPTVLRTGISYVFQRDSVFPQMTVLENLEIGAYIRTDGEGIQRDIDRVVRLFPVLQERRYEPANVLSGGERQMLEMARALLLHPKLILLDEPTLGLAPKVIRQVYEKIHEINQEGVTFLIVEQNARTALKNSHRAYVLENGQTRFEGTGEEILNNPEVRRAYLGG